MKVNYGEDYIEIIDNGNELLYWTEAEWQEDSQVVFSICNAVALALTEPEKLRAKLRQVVEEEHKKGVHIKEVIK